MSDDIVNMLMRGWDWRSDMGQPSPYDSRGQQPEAQSFRPRTILDNVPPMVADGLSSAGVSGPVAGDYANRIKGLAHAMPPLNLLNLASGIGNEAHNGNYGKAAGLSAVSALMGLYARGLMPGNRDAGIAEMLSRGPARVDFLPPGLGARAFSSRPGMHYPENINMLVNRGALSPANTNRLFDVVSK